MNSKVKKGVGIGCSLLLVAFMILLGSTIYFTRQMDREYKVVKELERQLVEAQGPGNQLPEGVTGWPDTARLEDFLGVRTATAEWRLNLETAFAKVMATDQSRGDAGLRKFFNLVRASRDLAPVFSGFWTVRNQALLDREMGIAEYKYLYCLTYYGFLGKDPSDGARDAGDFLAGMGAQGAMENTADSTEAEAERRRWTRSQINGLMIPLLQQAARTAAESSDPDQLVWAEAMQAEIRVLQDDDQRMPFAGTLPAPLAEVFAPFKESLENSYSITVNPVELIFEESWVREE